MCRASSVTDGRNRWLDAFNAVRDRWRDDRPAHDLHAFFAGGSFVPSATIGVEGTYAVPLERLADRLLSMSTSSPERLGDKVPAMKDAMREALAPFAVGGMIEDVVEARAEVFVRATLDQGPTRTPNEAGWSNHAGPWEERTDAAIRSRPPRRFALIAHRGDSLHRPAYFSRQCGPAFPGPADLSDIDLRR